MKIELKRLFLLFILNIMYTKMKYIVSKTGRDRILTPINGNYDSLLIWLHGLGDSADGFVEFFNFPNSPTPNSMKIILLTAPEEPVTINGGMIMNSWFDIKNLDEMGSVDEDHVKRNSKRVIELIKEEAKTQYINSNYQRIFIGGFSQGGCMSLYIGNNLNETLGGILSCSGYFFPFIKNININLPVFAYHGKDDPVLPYSKAVKSYERLKGNSNFSFTSESSIGHSISYNEIQEMEKFFKSNIKV
jgi:predicted esterase